MPTQAEIDQDYKRLKVLLEDTDTFVLTFVLYRDIKEQRANAEKLKDRLDLPITEVALKGDNLNPVYTFLDLPKEPRQAIFYTFLGSSLPEGKSDFDQFAGYVNIQREAFTDAPHAVVLWLREEQLVRLMRRAPDFWAWRSGVFDVRGKLQPDTSPSPYRELEEVDAVERGELEHQVALYREILKGQLEREKPDLAYVARTRIRLQSTLYRLGLYKEMAEEAQELVELSTKLESLLLRSEGLSNLATAYKNLGRYEEAKTLYHEAIEIEKTIGREQPIYASKLNDIANLLQDEGQYDEAEKFYRKAIEIDAKTLGEEHLIYIAKLNNLAGLLKDTERYEEAEVLYRKAVSLAEKTVGEDHPYFGIALSNLAYFSQVKGQYDEAEKLYHKAIEIDAKTLGKRHPNYAQKLDNLADLLWRIGRYSEAESSRREALGIFSERFGTNHPRTRFIAESYNNFLQELEPQPPNP